MSGYEVVANHWFVMDQRGFLSSLRSKTYFVDGSESDKIEFLKSRAGCDYAVAKEYGLPSSLKIRVVSTHDLSSAEIDWLHISDIEKVGGVSFLFDDVAEGIEQAARQRGVWRQHGMVVVVTPLNLDDDGSVFPVVTGNVKLRNDFLDREYNFNSFHRLWSSCSSSPSYDKKAWIEVERQLLNSGVF